MHLLGRRKRFAVHVVVTEVSLRVPDSPAKEGGLHTMQVVRAVSAEEAGRRAFDAVRRHPDFEELVEDPQRAQFSAEDVFEVDRGAESTGLVFFHE